MTRSVQRYLPLLLIALLWEAATQLGLVSELVMPTLSSVLIAWANLVASGELISNALDSLYRAGVGLFLSIVIGGAAGIFMAWSRVVNVLVSPIVEAMYPLPKSVLIPETALWLGFGDASKILLIFLGCMIPVTIGAFNGALVVGVASNALARWSRRPATVISVPGILVLVPGSLAFRGITALLESDLSWTRSTGGGSSTTAPLWHVVSHLFNHQTHHRGQLTTLLSQLGRDPGPTDFILLAFTEEDRQR